MPYGPYKHSNMTDTWETWRSAYLHHYWWIVLMGNVACCSNEWRRSNLLLTNSWTVRIGRFSGVHVAMSFQTHDKCSGHMIIFYDEEDPASLPPVLWCTAHWHSVWISSFPLELRNSTTFEHASVCVKCVPCEIPSRDCIVYLGTPHWLICWMFSFKWYNRCAVAGELLITEEFMSGRVTLKLDLTQSFGESRRLLSTVSKLEVVMLTRE